MRQLSSGRMCYSLPACLTTRLSSVKLRALPCKKQVLPCPPLPLPLPLPLPHPSFPSPSHASLTLPLPSPPPAACPSSHYLIPCFCEFLLVVMPLLRPCLVLKPSHPSLGSSTCCSPSHPRILLSKPSERHHNLSHQQVCVQYNPTLIPITVIASTTATMTTAVSATSVCRRSAR